MSTQLAGIRPARFTATTYRAFILTDAGRPHPLNIGEATDLQAAVDAAKVLCAHKDTLAIRVDQDGSSKLRIYAIRKKAGRWLHLAGEHLPRRIEEHYADPVCIVDPAVFG